MMPQDYERFFAGLMRAFYLALLVIAVLAVSLVVSCTCRAAERISPLQATFVALQDAAGLPVEVRPFVRYVYVPDGTAESRGAISFLANAAIYTSAQIQQAVAVSDHIVRLDFLEGGGDLKTWERLWPDPLFNVAFGGVVRKEITVAPYVASDGKTYTRKVVEQRLIFPAHCLPHAQPLADLLGTNVPIIDARFLVVRSLSTVDQGYGDGLYYDFVGIKRSVDKQRTDEELFYDGFGIDLKRARKNLVVSRAAILNRNLNNKLAAVEIVQGEAHPATTDGKIYATFDLQDRDADVGRDPIENLLGFIDGGQHRASEVIAPRRNGLHLFALFDASGKLQFEVPPDVAVWSGVPSGHTNRLIPGMACIQCHSTGKEMGLRTFTNDARDLPALFDFADKNSRERLRSEYGFDLARPVAESRNYLADATFLATNGMSVEATGAAVFALWADFLYNPVTARTALLDLGIETADEPAARLRLAEIKTSNAYIQSLVIGKQIGRKQWSRVLPDVAAHTRKDYP